jgi:NAD(P)-dependent dehydrogenase (short-subunit alcohol dehydrogenase family)
MRLCQHRCSLQQADLDGKCFGTPVAYNGKLYMQTTKHLYCWGKKGNSTGLAEEAKAELAKVKRERDILEKLYLKSLPEEPPLPFTKEEALAWVGQAQWLLVLWGFWLDRHREPHPDELQPIGILVNNAGITADGLLARMSLDQWQRVLDTNLTGSFAVTRELIRGMMRRRWGRIVTVSSVVGLMGNAGQANYAAAKAGLIGFTKSVARELASRNITANVVAPGFVETAMTAVLPEETRQKMLADIPLARFGRVEEIAAAVTYLASEEAGYVTGQVLNGSGGLYI